MASTTKLPPLPLPAEALAYLRLHDESTSRPKTVRDKRAKARMEAAKKRLWARHDAAEAAIVERVFETLKFPGGRVFDDFGNPYPITSLDELVTWAAVGHDKVSVARAICCAILAHAGAPGFKQPLRAQRGSTLLSGSAWIQSAQAARS